MVDEKIRGCANIIESQVIRMSGTIKIDYILGLPEHTMITSK